jgi:hypothetical protein
LKKAGSSATITAITKGTILKQADDAGKWIQQNILTVNDGPFGMLWVRQGTVGVDVNPDGIDTRRDVISSVRGQIVSGNRPGSEDNAVAETINGLCKTELLHRKGPGRDMQDPEMATLGWVDGFNNRRPLRLIGNIPAPEGDHAFAHGYIEVVCPHPT